MLLVINNLRENMMVRYINRLLLLTISILFLINYKLRTFLTYFYMKDPLIRLQVNYNDPQLFRGV